MERDLERLENVLRQIAHDAGCALLYKNPRENIVLCIARYNRVHARVQELTPVIASRVAFLPDDASAGEVRIASRALAAYIAEHLRKEHSRVHEGACLLGFIWPCGSLKFDLC